MRRDLAYVWALLVLILLSPSLIAAQAAAPQHPLEGLTSGEYWAVHEVLQASGKMTPDTLVMSLLLHEPAKEKVLAWKAGDPFTREADVVLMRKGVVAEVRVNMFRDAGNGGAPHLVWRMFRQSRCVSDLGA